MNGKVWAKKTNLLLLLLLIIFLSGFTASCGGYNTPTGGGEFTPYIVVVTPTVNSGVLTAKAEGVNLTASALTASVAPRPTPTLNPTFAPAATTQAAPRPTASLAVTDDKYTVKDGDTLVGIATRLKVNLQELIRVNNIDNANVLRIGQVLIIPKAVPTPTP